MDSERAELDYEAEGKRDDLKGASLGAFEGRSNRRYSSTANDLHLAVQRAALAAADAQESDEEWYDLTQLRVLISKNPNVKVYAATLVKSPGSDR